MKEEKQIIKETRELPKRDCLWFVAITLGFQRNIQSESKNGLAPRMKFTDNGNWPHQI